MVSGDLCTGRRGCSSAGDPGHVCPAPDRGAAGAPTRAVGRFYGESDQTAAVASFPLQKQAHGARFVGSGGGAAASVGIAGQWGSRLGDAVSAAGTNALHSPLLDFALDPSGRSALELYRSWESTPLYCIVDAAARLLADRHHFFQPDKPDVGALAWRATFDDGVNRLLIHVSLQCQ